MIRKYYRPKIASSDRNVELTLYVLYGRSAEAVSELPAALGPAIQQLRQLTNLKSFHVAEVQMSRVRSGKKIEANGFLSGIDGPESFPYVYESSCNVWVNGAVVKLDNFRFTAKLPIVTKIGDNSHNYRDASISSSLDVKPGQQVVVGKTNTSAKDGALILVVSAKLLD